MRGNKFLSRPSLLCFAFLFAGTAALAQTQTQGAITGTVEDSTGAAIPKAAIVVHNDATNADTNLTADDSGYFNAPLLQPGEYKVTITASGFATYVQNDVIVQISQATELRPHLGIGKAEQTVEVTGVTPDINFESPQFSDTLTNAQIVNAPMNNRRWSSLALTTPGVVSDSNGYGLVSIRGVSPLMNNVLIDGADDNQAFFSEERGRTREAYSTSQDSVREFSVNTGVFPAEFGRAAGGVINSVTKSGGNQLHGELYFYDRQSNWAAYTPLVTNAVLNPTTGTYQNISLKPKDLRKIWGVSAGGALIKDKLFWYYTYDQHHHIFPGVGRPSNPTTFFTLPETNLGANETCDLSTGELYTGDITKPSSNTQNEMACVLAARLKLSSYAAGSSVYAAQLASVATTLGTVGRIGDQEINTPKLDFQINPKNRLSLLYHRLRWDSPGGVQTSATATYSTDAFGNDFVKLDYGLAKLDSQITSKISNEVGYQYSRELDFETQPPLTPYTQQNLTSNGNVNYVNLATSSGFNLGSPYYSYRAAYPDERKWQVFDTAYWIKGNHSLKFGVDMLHNWDLINNTYESNGDYSYSYIGNYFADVYAKQNGLANGGCASGAAQTAVYSSSTGKVSSTVGNLSCYNDYFQGYGNPLFDITTTDFGYFVQDDWKVRPRLTVELGVRYDYQQLPNPVSSLTQASGSYTPFPGVTNRPSDKNNFGPRIGFAYDMFGHGHTVLRGGWGLYYGRVLNGTVENIYLNTGSPLGQYTTTFLPTTAGAPVAFPQLSQSGGSAPSAPSVYFFDKHFQNPQVNEFDLILQQDLGRTVVLNMSYLGGLGRELPNFVDQNLDPTTVKPDAITFKGGGPIPDGTVVQVPTYTAYGNQALFGAVAKNFQAITEAVSNINSSYNALVFELKTRNLYGLEADVNYTWSHALDYSQNALTQGSGNDVYDPYGPMRPNYGNSNYNVPNRFVAYALYRIPNVHSGNWVKYLANDWTFSDDFQMQNGLPYSVSLSGTPNGAKLSGLNGSGGQTFIPTGVISGFGVGRNTLQVKRGMVDDIRVVKGIPITESKVLELRADLFNVANHQNIGGVSATAYIFNSAGTLTNNAVYQPTTFGVPSSINSSGFSFTPREIQISARFAF